MTDNPTLARLAVSLREPGASAVVAIIFQTVSDSDLRDEWQRTSGEPSDPLADLIRAEAQRRGIDL